MSASINYLCTRANFKQVSEAIPITKQRNPQKVDPLEVFEGMLNSNLSNRLLFMLMNAWIANKKELVADLITKAKQIEFLIQSLPVPEAEEEQVYHTCDLF